MDDNWDAILELIKIEQASAVRKAAIDIYYSLYKIEEKQIDGKKYILYDDVANVVNKYMKTSK